MWKQSESTAKPLEVDETSSKSVVYVRRNITEVIVQDENSEDRRTVWKYEENKIPKSDWETYKAIMENQSETTDLELAVCELYEMLAFGGVK